MQLVRRSKARLLRNGLANSLASKCLAFTVAVGVYLGFAGTAKAAVISAGSAGYGELALGSLDAGVLTAVIISGPFPRVSGTAPPAYSLTNSAASATAGATLVTTVFGLSTGILGVNASSNVDGLPGARSATADATVNGADVFLRDTTAAVLFFDLFGTQIASTASVSGDFGALTAAGTTTLTGTSLFVAGVGAIAITSSPAPNTLVLPGVLAPLGLTVTLNEQILGGDGISSRSLIVNAIHIRYDSFLTAGGVTVTGDVFIAHSDARLVAQADAAAVPEPSTLALLAVGLGSLAARRWRRRSGPAMSPTGEPVV